MIAKDTNDDTRIERLNARHLRRASWKAIHLNRQEIRARCSCAVSHSISAFVMGLPASGIGSIGLNSINGAPSRVMTTTLSTDSTVDQLGQLVLSFGDAVVVHCKVIAIRVAIMHLDPQMNRFLRASRSLFNSYFAMEEPWGDPHRAWDLRDHFNPVQAELFKALVLHPSEIAGVEYGEGPQPILVRPTTDGILPHNDKSRNGFGLLGLSIDRVRRRFWLALL